MCQFKSLIVTRTEIFHDLDIDYHEELIRAHGLNDKTQSPDFVRVEYLPVDGDIFNHARENWKLSVDQDYRPEWFSEKEAAEACWPMVEATFKARFLSSGIVQRIERGRWFLSGSATIESVLGSATIESVLGSATIKSVGDSATIKSVGDSATIKSVGGSATIESVGGSATIKSVGDSATIESVLGSATIESVGDSATIKSVGGSATIKSVLGSATIESVWGSATIESVGDSAVLAGVYSTIAKWALKDKAIAVIRYETPTRIVTVEKGAKLETV